ncbi:MAG TPA: lysophospholipid acyltransferase family protein, partial [Gemmataceae bacterium]
MSGWLARRWYDLAYWPCFLATIFGFSLRVAGRRNMPAAGPVLVLSNHQSHLDPVLLGVASPRRLASLARRTLFRNRFFAALIRSLGAFPIDQEGVGKEGIKTVLDLLASGRAVVVYPEGHRTPDGRLQPLLPGISLILRRARVPVVPCGIAGAYHAWPRSRNYPVPSPLFCPASE